MMQTGTTSRLAAICFDASDPHRLARFWADALGWEVEDVDDDEVAGIVPTDGTTGQILFLRVPEPKTGKNRLHLDIAPPTHVDQAAEVERLLALGATRIDIGQRDVSWVVMADPDGNEFCVLTPR
jgi:predicted enzyme related to lactoylglutathione lyase